jgi:phenylalanyl-tRNA synthetase alpha chain
MQGLDDILQQAKSAIHAANDLATLDQCRVQYLGKKGQVTELLKTLGQLSAEERPAAGQKINTVKQAIVAWLDERNAVLSSDHVKQQLAQSTIDVTLAGRGMNQGSIHPVAKTMEALRHIFTQMGFVCLEGPEIEDDHHNFSALNIPEHHPARAMQDTFYFADSLLLRTHMSPVQIRAMKKMKPPLRMVAMGRVYRRDFDITHTPMFHQIECLMVDEQVTFANLKQILKVFLEAFFEREITIRLRPSYFPFTELSAEVDIGCIKCNGKGCRICKNTGFLEVLGCGMVHPNVLNMAGIDAERYRGFAFGAGIDRLTMLKYNISDLRSLFENDIRFLNQFSST